MDGRRTSTRSRHCLYETGPTPKDAGRGFPARRGQMLGHASTSHSSAGGANVVEDHLGIEALGMSLHAFQNSLAFYRRTV